MMWNGADILGIFQGDPLNCCNTDLVICAEAALSHTSRFIFHHTPFTDHICYKVHPEQNTTYIAILYQSNIM